MQSVGGLTFSPSQLFVVILLGAFWSPSILLWGTLGGILLIALDYVRTKDPSFSHFLALQKYFRFRAFYIYGYFVSQSVDRDSKDIRKTQEDALMKILKMNSASEYSKKHGLDRVRNREEYRKAHPLSKYGQFKAFIDRQANGERNVIVTDEPIFYGTTSGTTGQANLVPLASATRSAYIKLVALTLYKTVATVPAFSGLSRRLKLLYNPSKLLPETPTGIKIGPMSACTKIFPLGPFFTSPPAAFDLLKEDACRYVHVLFALRQRHLKVIEAVFVPIVYYAFEEIEREWETLVRDIRQGTLRQDLDIPHEIRLELAKNLTPDPSRAKELETEFQMGFKSPIARRIWPELEMITCIKGGPFKNYTRLLQEKFTDDLLIFDSFYGATEGILGVNIWPHSSSSRYLPCPWMLFMEFIKAENIPDDQPETLFMDQLEIGQDYELVLTTAGGLYRYRFGDVVRVVDYHNQLPILEFQYRSGHLLNIRGEKIPETTLADALTDALKTTPNVQNVLDSTLCTSIGLPKEAQKPGELPYYVYFVELVLSENADVNQLQRELSSKIDGYLMDNHKYYKYYRDKGAMASVSLHLVRSNGFADLRRFMLTNSTTSPSQLKIPKVLLKDNLIEFMYRQRLVTQPH